MELGNVYGCVCSGLLVLLVLVVVKKEMFIFVFVGLCRHVRLPNRMNFRKSAEGGGGGSFSIQKSILQILGTLNSFFKHDIETKE